ncbi:Alpha/Beta hydrolase protein [Geopyxis carbonaria]|nr:Alpha/Beta hydrolase protein [Geopyxis carbonaria]
MSSTGIHTERVSAIGGELIGIKLHDDDVVQYRGIPYGVVNERFSVPVIASSLNGKSLDCTKYGPISPQMDLDGERVWFSIPDDQVVPSIDSFRQDEFKCLNLNISVPSKLPNSEKVPVLVYIHGGFFSTGTANRKVEDLGCLVAFAARQGRPIIAVAMNYRLNLFGFSTVSGKGNYGLRDQRCALEWIHQHISDFGGDPSQITLAGDSTGASSVQAHLQNSPAGLFNRIILMSGSLATTRPRPVQKQEELMKKVCRQLGIAWKGEWEREIKAVPVEKLLEAFYELGATQVFPTLDDFFPKGELAPGDPEGVPSWCNAIFLGDNTYESAFWGLVVLRHEPEAITASIQPCLPANIASEVLKAYEISPQNDDTPENALKLLNDILFHYQMSRTAALWKSSGKKDVFQYVLDQRNPFTPEMETQHDANLLFCWGSYDVSAYPQAESVRHEFQTAITTFVYGQPPWESGAVFGFGPDGLSQKLNNKQYCEHRRVRPMAFLEHLDEGEIQRLVR